MKSVYRRKPKLTVCETFTTLKCFSPDQARFFWHWFSMNKRFWIVLIFGPWGPWLSASIVWFFREKLQQTRKNDFDGLWYSWAELSSTKVKGLQLISCIYFRWYELYLTSKNDQQIYASKAIIRGREPFHSQWPFQTVSSTETKKCKFWKGNFKCCAMKKKKWPVRKLLVNS